MIQELKKEDRQTWKDNVIVYVNRQIYIPNNRKIWEQVLHENHNLADVSHSEQTRMLEQIKQNYWWPEIKEDIKKYIQGYFKYQQNKVQHQKKVEELHLLEILQGPWQEISIDIIGPLPKSNGKDTIVVIVNRFTKMIRLKATITNISLEKIAKIYQNKIWKLHRVPKKILSNREPQFTSRFMEEFTKALGTTR